MYVALSNRDAVAAVDVSAGKDGAAAFWVEGYSDTRLPGQSYFGAEPMGLAIDGRRLYVANMGSDAVAVINTAKLTGRVAKKGMVEPTGFVPTELMPTALAVTRGRLFVTTAKGTGTGPNNFPQRPVEATKKVRQLRSASTYVASLIHGSVAMIETSRVDAELKQWTEDTVMSNRMKAADERIQFAGAGDASRIKHVIYIIKENRTYDQVLGDLVKTGSRWATETRAWRCMARR